MINQISINSNNTIELSRSQLLSWLNDLLNCLITKIQQLGTGAIYCQLLDILYPNKVQLTKVNFKAKSEYEYINNFKILQQHFTKFGITKHIQVEKLVKCKYQDNLEFLQWFKKIFDSHYSGGQEGSTVMRRSTSDNEGSQFSLEKENKKPITRALNFSVNGQEKGLNDMLKLQFSKDMGLRSMQSSTSRTKIDESRGKRQNSLVLKPSTERVFNKSNGGQYDRGKTLKRVENNDLEVSENLKANIIGVQTIKEQEIIRQPYYSPSKYLQKENFYKPSKQSQSQSNGYCNEEREFYLKKFKEIQHLLEIFQKNQHCEKLTTEIRKVIMIPPQTLNYHINEQTGEVIIEEQQNQQKDLASQFIDTVTQSKQQENAVSQ